MKEIGEQPWEFLPYRGKNNFPASTDPQLLNFPDSGMRYLGVLLSFNQSTFFQTW